MLQYLVVGSFIALIGCMGFFCLRSHGLLMLISLELIVLSIILNFVVGGWFFFDLVGQLNALLVLSVAVVESSIGLAFLIIVYKYKGIITLVSVKGLKT